MTTAFNAMIKLPLPSLQTALGVDQQMFLSARSATYEIGQNTGLAFSKNQWV